ncbi:MAG: hypothetical protein C4575_01710 [Desulforudis sp.]|nr:MAG: hypothetical protein C4575_01710 [Desulforudis sp.]
MFLCPKCGDTLLFVVADDTYQVNPETGKFRWVSSDGDTWFECAGCRARFETDDPELPFKYDPDEFRVMTKEAQPT